MGQVSFLFGCFFSQDVAFKRMLTLDFACTGKLKTLFGS
jgi:hypothetical protein